MSRPRKAVIVHSPHSGKSAQLSQVLASLRRNAIKVTSIIAIADLDGLPEQGPHWKEIGCDLVIAAGGDGLIGGVITHIGESGLSLGILPLGTSNDIARSVGIPTDPFQAVQILSAGKVIEVDVGIAQPAKQTPHSLHPAPGPPPMHLPPQQRARFAHTLTLGLNVQFARLATNVATRQRYGRLTYPIAAFEALRNHDALEMNLYFEGLAKQAAVPQPPLSKGEQPAALHCRALQVTVINAPIFGGAWQLAIPGASLHDGLLDIVVVEDVDLESLGNTISRLFTRPENQTLAPPLAEWHDRYPQLKAAELTGIPGLHYVQARGVLINTSADPQDVTLDGEVRGQTPIHVRQADERLRVIVPADQAI